MFEKIRKKLFVIAIVVFPTVMMAQQKFYECAAIFIGDQMIVDDYSPDGNCDINHDSRGLFTVQTVILSQEGVERTGKIHFRIAIRDGKTGTLFSYSERTFTEEKVENILAICKPGDSIYVITTDVQYSLPHNEISIHFFL